MKLSQKDHDCRNRSVPPHPIPNVTAAICHAKQGGSAENRRSGGSILGWQQHHCHLLPPDLHLITQLLVIESGADAGSVQRCRIVLKTFSQSGFASQAKTREIRLLSATSREVPTGRHRQHPTHRPHSELLAMSLHRHLPQYPHHGSAAPASCLTLLMFS